MEDIIETIYKLIPIFYNKCFGSRIYLEIRD